MNSSNIKNIPPPQSAFQQMYSHASDMLFFSMI